MSIHHLECAATQDLAPAKKLALMAVCDSADKETGVAIPGLDMVMRWAGVRRSRTLELLAELVAEGYLYRQAGARRGRRAEFVVFSSVPCCVLHGPRLPVQVVDAPTGNGSATPDPRSDPPNGSAPSDPNEANGSDKGSDKGSDNYRTPSVSTDLNNPPTPTGVGEPNPENTHNPTPPPCPTHGTTRSPSCRGCGTNPRAARDAERAQAKHRARRVEDEARAARETARRSRTPSEDAPDAWRAARQRIAGRAS